MNNDNKHKITFYNACYYLCGLSHDATSFYHEKNFKITDTLEACVYRYLKLNDDFGEAYFSIHFEKNEKKLWGTLIKFNLRKSKKVSTYFWNNCSNNIDYIFSSLNYLKPSNNYFARATIPQISIEEQNNVIEIVHDIVNEALKNTNKESKITNKTRKLIKLFNG